MAAPVFLLRSRSPRTPIDALEAIGAGFQAFANAHFAPAWGLAPCSMSEYSTTVDAAAPGAWIVTCYENEADKADELGDHDEDGRGHPRASILLAPILDSGGGLFVGGKVGVSVASVIAHEAFEMWIDPNINRVRFMPSGLILAEEVSDPVEANAIKAEGRGEPMEFSNAVLPPYFDAHATGGLDIAGELVHPFSMTAGGYQSIFDPKKGEWSQVFAEKSSPKHVEARAIRAAARGNDSRRRRRTSPQTAPTTPASELTRRLWWGS